MPIPTFEEIKAAAKVIEHVAPETTATLRAHLPEIFGPVEKITEKAAVKPELRQIANQTHDGAPLFAAQIELEALLKEKYHWTAIISPDATIGRNVIIGENAYIAQKTIIGDGAVIGDGASIEQYAQVGDRSVIGKASKLNMFSSIGVETKIGDRVEIGSQSMIGDRTYLGGVSRLESDVRVGNDTNIGGGAVIKSHTRIGSNVSASSGLATEEHVVIEDRANIPEDVSIGEKAHILMHDKLTPGTRVLQTPHPHNQLLRLTVPQN